MKDFLSIINKTTHDCKCSKCGKVIKVPNLVSDKNKKCLNPFCCAFTVFVVQYLIHEGWHVRDLGITDRHPYFCPDCWEEGTPEFSKREYCDDWYKQSMKWLNEYKQ